MDFLYEFTEEQMVQLPNYGDQIKPIEKGLKFLIMKIETSRKSMHVLLDNEHLSIDMLRDTIKRIRELVTEWEEKHNQYSMVLFEVEIINTDLLREAMEASSNFTTQLLSELCEIENQYRLDQNSQLNRTMSCNSVNSIGCSQRDLIKLPEISLKKFSGENRMEFKGFFNQFVSLIDERTDLSDQQKLIYLKNSVTRTAYETIGNLSAVAENYQRAKTLLKTEFYDVQSIKALLFEAILNITHLKQERPKDLLKSLVHIRAQLNELESMDCNLLDETTSGYALYSHVLSSNLQSYF